MRGIIVYSFVFVEFVLFIQAQDVFRQLPGAISTEHAETAPLPAGVISRGQRRTGQLIGERVPAVGGHRDGELTPRAIGRTAGERRRGQDRIGGFPRGIVGQTGDPLRGLGRLGGFSRGIGAHIGERLRGPDILGGLSRGTGGQSGEFIRGVTGQTGESMRGVDPRFRDKWWLRGIGQRETAVRRTVAAPTSRELRAARRIVNTLTELMSPRRRIVGGRVVRACTQYLDFMFLQDSSASIGQAEFTQGLEASKETVQFLNDVFRCPISRRGSRVGLIEFSSRQKTHLEFSFYEHTSEQAVLNAIDAVSYDNGPRTATGLALRMARIQFQLSQLSGPQRNQKVAWVVTDGNHNTGVSPITAADELRQLDVKICAIAIGRNIDMSEINDMADSGCVFRFESFSSYRRALRAAIRWSMRSSGSRGTRLPGRGLSRGLTSDISVLPADAAEEQLPALTLFDQFDPTFQSPVIATGAGRRRASLTGSPASSLNFQAAGGGRRRAFLAGSPASPLNFQAAGGGRRRASLTGSPASSLNFQAAGGGRRRASFTGSPASSLNFQATGAGRRRGSLTGTPVIPLSEFRATGVGRRRTSLTGSPETSLSGFRGLPAIGL